MYEERHEMLFMRFRSRVSIKKPTVSQMSVNAKSWGLVSIIHKLVQGPRPFIGDKASNLSKMSYVNILCHNNGDEAFSEKVEMKSPNTHAGH